VNLIVTIPTAIKQTKVPKRKKPTNKENQKLATLKVVGARKIKKVVEAYKLSFLFFSVK
jgi:hypothetical protein